MRRDKPGNGLPNGLLLARQGFPPVDSLRSSEQALERCEAGYKEALAARSAELDALRLRSTAQDVLNSRGQR